ncbi:MAG: LysR family transcriptional regulator [Vicinamibacterales bacterium]
MTLDDLRVFIVVATERSFSRAGRKLRRTQPAISQTIRRLEDACGERLIDRSLRDGTLTDAGRLLLDYAHRVTALADEASSALAGLRDLRTGRVTIGANEAGVHMLLPILAEYRTRYPDILVDIRRVPSRQMAQEVLLRTLDFGVLTFAPAERDLQSLVIGADDLVLLVAPGHPLTKQKVVTIEDVGKQPIIAHNDPSPARDRVLRLYEQRHAELNIRISLPSLDGIKRAVEMGLGVAVLPRRCAVSELARRTLTAIVVPGLRSPRSLRLISRRSGDLSHAAQAFVEVARKYGSRASTRATWS